jgi:predicted nucleic acid-binding OB-fold protein
VDSYLKRHLNFQVKYSQYLEIERAVVDNNLEVYIKFFNKLEAIYIKLYIKPSDR